MRFPLLMVRNIHLLTAQLLLPGLLITVTSSNGNSFRVTGHLWGESTWRSSVNSPHKGQWRGALIFSLICSLTNDWANNGHTGDLRRHHAYYEVTVMLSLSLEWIGAHIDYRKVTVSIGSCQIDNLAHFGLWWHRSGSIMAYCLTTPSHS